MLALYEYYEMFIMNKISREEEINIENGKEYQLEIFLILIYLTDNYLILIFKMYQLHLFPLVIFLKN